MSKKSAKEKAEAVVGEPTRRIESTTIPASFFTPLLYPTKTESYAQKKRVSPLFLLNYFRDSTIIFSMFGGTTS